jgi:regulator of protease activity HflC (stomatin/prohibitin superfamily)
MALSPGGLPGGGNLVFLLVGALVLVWLASGFYIVDTGQRGMVLRFGKYVETTEPGPRWHLPWPVESREIVNVDQVRTVEIGYRNNVKSKVLNESLMLTDDENIIDLQFAVQYILKDPGRVSVRQPLTRRQRCCRWPKPRCAKSSARARWTSCCMKAVPKSPIAPSN